MKLLHIDQEKLKRAMQLHKKLELHLELLHSCSSPLMMPNLRIYPDKEKWTVCFEKYQEKIHQLGETPGAALDKLIEGSIDWMEEFLLLGGK